MTCWWWSGRTRVVLSPTHISIKVIYVLLFSLLSLWNSSPLRYIIFPPAWYEYVISPSFHFPVCERGNTYARLIVRPHMWSCLVSHKRVFSSVQALLPLILFPKHLVVKTTYKVVESGLNHDHYTGYRRIWYFLTKSRDECRLINMWYSTAFLMYISLLLQLASIQ